MKRFWLLSLAVVATPVLAAQQPSDTAAARLRAQIEQRFTERVQQELKLTSDQATKLRTTQERFGEQRRTLVQQQVERRRALDDQMQPGIAANSDSVRKLMDGIQAGRAQMLKLEQDQDKEMAGYLTPVQRARYQQIRERFMQRVNEMRVERRERGQMGPRMRPGMRAGRRRG